MDDLLQPLFVRDGVVRAGRGGQHVKAPESICSSTWNKPGECLYLVFLVAFISLLLVWSQIMLR